MTTTAPAPRPVSPRITDDGSSLPRFGMHVFRDVMVPMRDGVRLATDIHLPALDGQALDGPFPTIFGRTSYDKSDPSMWVRPVAEYFVPRGYAVVLQDLRGR
jgi:predicted acyl esterase